MASNVSKSAWALPIAICCLIMTLFFIAATVVLALIPVYLSRRDVTVDKTQQQETLSAGYATDATGAGSDTLTGTSSLSTQLLGASGLSTSDVSLNSGSFLTSAAASRRRRRQTINSNGTITCEKATGLTGDIFVAQYQLTYPTSCSTISCKTRTKTKTLTSIRNNYQPITITMNFTIAGSKTVRLIFCGIFSESSSGCTTETKSYIYLMSTDFILRQFNPTTYDLKEVGTINCSTSGRPYAISLQRSGILWVLSEYGNISRYNIKSGVCSSTTFTANQSGFEVFSMTFLKKPTDTSETLYVSKQNDPPNSLGKIDTNTLTLSNIGNYTSGFNTYAEISATSSGTLYGLFQSTNYTIAQIDTSNANIIAQYPLNISITVPDLSFAFTNANGVFFVFEGLVNGTNIHTFNIASNTTTLVKTVSQFIYSAAVSSSCIGTV